jgi:hypothetical protein
MFAKGAEKRMDLRKIPEIEKLLNQIEQVQGDWDFRCSRIECYWNLWHPNSMWNNDESKVCVSESLRDTKMIPNSKSCPSYWDYEDACGCKKGE